MIREYMFAAIVADEPTKAVKCGQCEKTMDDDAPMIRVPYGHCLKWCCARCAKEIIGKLDFNGLEIASVFDLKGVVFSGA